MEKALPFERFGMKIDQGISQYFSSHHNRCLSSILGALTHLGTGAFWISAYVLFLIFFYDPLAQLIFTLILAEIIGLLSIIILRTITKRERPITNYKTFPFTPWNRYSFPSHHALRSFIIAVIVGLDFPRLLPYLLVMAAIVSFSRIYLSKHYLSDVLVGVLLGVFVAMSTQMLI